MRLVLVAEKLEGTEQFQNHRNGELQEILEDNSEDLYRLL